MTWTDKDAQVTKSFLDSETGQKFIKELHSLRPSPICEPHEHQAAYRLGGVAGYEACEAKIISLSVVKPPPKPEVQANYGVPDSKATPA